MINFFAKYWPELFEMGVIYKVMTPLVVAKKGKQMLTFYTNDEFDRWVNKKTTNPSTWNIEYKKGLAALEDDEYEEIIKNPKAIRLNLDKDSKDTLEAWFGKESQLRKDRLITK